MANLCKIYVEYKAICLAINLFSWYNYDSIFLAIAVSQHYPSQCFFKFVLIVCKRKLLELNTVWEITMYTSQWKHVSALTALT